MKNHLNLLVFTVMDLAVQTYLEPFFARTEAEAQRGFRLAVNREGHDFNMSPEDYHLYRIGEYDIGTATLMGVAPRSLGSAVSYLTKDKTDRSRFEEIMNAHTPIRNDAEMETSNA